jgi:hypothetical protein
LTLKWVQSAVDQRLSPVQVQSLADRLGEQFGSAPETTWLQVDYLATDQYAENDTRLGDGDRPVFVEILKRAPDPDTVRRGEAAAIAAIVAEVTGRTAGRVHVIYLAPGAGRVAFGGELG